MTTTIRSSADGSKSYIQVGGTDRVTIGSQGIEAGSYTPGSIVANDLADGALIENAPISIGYGVGAGGTVTQATSKSTAVTLNKPCGQITMNAASLAAGKFVIFIMNNNAISTGDTLVVNLAGGTGDGANYRVEAYFVDANVAGFMITNISTVALAEALVLAFAVIKGAAS